MKPPPAVVFLGGAVVAGSITYIAMKTSGSVPSTGVPDVVDVTPDTMIVDGYALVHLDHVKASVSIRCVIKPHYPIGNQVICVQLDEPKNHEQGDYR